MVVLHMYTYYIPGTYKFIFFKNSKNFIFLAMVFIIYDGKKITFFRNG